MKCNLLLQSLHSNEYIQELHCYPFTVKPDKFAGSCNILNDLSKRVYVPIKTEDIIIHVFNMITGKNESKILTKRYIMRI